MDFNEDKVFLKGDLCQMAAQKTYLERRGIPTGQCNVYPTVMKKDWKEILTLIYSRKVEGWWNYYEDCIAFGLCKDLEDWQEHFD